MKQTNTFHGDGKEYLVSENPLLPLLKEMLEVLEFYGDLDTYFAIGFFTDPPCGGFITDFEDGKPGKKARKIIKKVQKIVNKS